MAEQKYLAQIVETLMTRQPLVINPPSQPRRAAVALVLRCRPKKPVMSTANVDSVKGFFDQAWVDDSEPELLYMLRATRATDQWSGHVAFPGGKADPGETDRETAIREVQEELGLNLSSGAFIELGQLDSREIKAPLDNKLMMILTPFVFLQTVPETPTMSLQESEVAAVKWVPLSFFLTNEPYNYDLVTQNLAPRSMRKGTIAPFARLMMGTVSFPAIDLPTLDNDSHNFRLWGITLGMTRDLMVCAEGRPAWHNHTSIQSTKETFPFVKFAKSPPLFSHKDISFMFWVMYRVTAAKSNLFKSRQNMLPKIDRENETMLIAFQRAIGLAIVLRFSGSVWLIYFVIKKLMIAVGSL
ncbi:NUDIX hydrolase domain-like protein [Phycomyces nitens]|nr:NUDIX hydrolase domain-like protein [Phycomyces nitens]